MVDLLLVDGKLLNVIFNDDTSRNCTNDPKENELIVEVIKYSGTVNAIVSKYENGLAKTTDNIAENDDWTVVLSLDWKDIDWNWIGLRSDITVLHVSICVPSPHAEYTSILSFESTTGGVNIDWTVI